MIRYRRNQGTKRGDVTDGADVEGFITKKRKVSAGMKSQAVAQLR
jgi:hypothetical protein